ncbi:MAG: fibronectin type III domain-containing protein, partial [Thermoplasmatota archaeon]
EPGPGSIKISWGRSSTPGSEPARVYIITRRTALSEPSVVANVEAGTRSYLDEQVVRKTLYFYSIQIVTDSGTSESSHEVSAKPLTYPDPPTDVKVSATGHGLEVTWSPPRHDGGLGVTWYSIFREDPIGLNVLIKNVDGFSTSITDNSVDPGFYYSYTVKAHNLAVSSDHSEPAGNVFPGSPKAPDLVNVELVAGRIMITWTPNATDQGEYTDSYNIYRTSTGMQVTRIAKVDGYVKIYLDGEIEGGTSYEYYITAENEAGESTASETMTIFIEKENTADSKEKEGPDILTFSLIALLVLLVLVIIVMATAGRKRADDGETYDWEEE